MTFSPTKKQTAAVIVACALILLAVLYALVFRPMLLKVKYRLAYEDSILRYANEYALDPYFVCAVIFSESSFRQDAVSPVGATGLMQLMPQTAAEIADKLDIDGFTESMLRDTDLNIRFGCFYLRQQLDRFDQNPNVVLCAYNAGPGKAQEWLEKYGLDTSGNIAYIPYGETDRYVDRVNSAMRVYRKLYPDVFSAEVSKHA